MAALISASLVVIKLHLFRVVTVVAELAITAVRSVWLLGVGIRE